MLKHLDLKLLKFGLHDLGSNQTFIIKLFVSNQIMLKGYLMDDAQQNNGPQHDQLFIDYVTC